MRAYLWLPNARKDRFADPTPRRVNGKDTFVTIIHVPIFNPRTDEVIGAVGCLLDLSVIQPLLMDTLNAKEEIALSIAYSQKRLTRYSRR